MKIALFPSAFHPNLGGVEELTRQLAHALTRRGHGVCVVSQHWPLDLPAHETFEGLPLHRVPFAGFEETWTPRALKSRVRYGARRRVAERETARVVSEFGADLVHIQCAGPNAFYALQAARELNLPLILSAQGELTMDATDIYGRSSWLRQTLRAITREAAGITACSRDALDDLEKFAGAPLPANSRVLYNGISLADFEAVPDAHVAARPYVFALGRMVAQKGFDVLIEAFARAELRDADLIIAGDGPQRGALETLARSRGLGARVQFWGRANRTQVVQLMRGAAWFVLPSRVEPQGIVNLEAMAAGRAVIAARTGGVPEIVLDGATGILFEPGDAESLARAMRALWQDENLRARLGAAGQNRAREFDWDVLAAQYEAIYAAAAR